MRDKELEYLAARVDRARFIIKRLERVKEEREAFAQREVKVICTVQGYNLYLAENGLPTEGIKNAVLNELDAYMERLQAELEAL